jgi:hypothetical protein
MSLTTFSGPVKSENGFIGPVANTTLTAASTLTAADSGRTLFLSATAEFATTLPAPAAGLSFSYTIVTSGSANIIKGVQFTAEDAGGSGDSGTADDTITFVDGQAVAGDRVDLVCDGTNWFAYAFTKLVAGLTFTQAS